MKIKAIIHPAEEGGYWAEVPALPGCITEGDSLEEVTHNLKDAIKGWLAVANESYEIKSFIGTSEVEDLKNALGQYVLYEKIIKRQLLDRTLYLAIRENTFNSLFHQEIGQILLEEKTLKLIIFNPDNEVITQWIN